MLVLFWNVESRTFESIDVPYPNLSIDRLNQKLLTIEANSAASHTYCIYEFINDSFALVNSLTIEAIHPSEYDEYGISEHSEEVYQYFHEYSVNDNESTLVNSIISYSGDEYSDKIVDLYYSDESLWQLNSIRFYMSDYGRCLGFHDKEGNPMDIHFDYGN